jgi:hypothetical protein
MSSEPAVHIAIRVGDAMPSVFSTALKPSETRRLAAWLSEHPELDALIQRARQLVEAEDEAEGWPS